MHSGEEDHAWPGWTTSIVNTWTGLLVKEFIEMTEDRDKWRKYVHGVANPRIEDGYRTEQPRRVDRVTISAERVRLCHGSPQRMAIASCDARPTVTVVGYSTNYTAELELGDRTASPPIVCWLVHKEAKGRPDMQNAL